MHVMNLERSWILLQQRVFNGNRCPPKLQHLGKMIAKSCKGIPLAIEVVSGTLRANLTPAAWEEMAEGIKTATEYREDAEHLLEILRLSYFYLPHNLRPCLLYLGIFPDDYEIRASRIINLWVAEGFLNESGSDKTFEETAEEHLEDLVTRNLVRVAKRKSDGRIKSFSIHHLTREMCIKQACVDSFFLLIGRHGMPAQALELQRRLSTSYHNYHILENSYGSTVRSIIFSGAEGGIQCSSVYLRLLRVLDLLNASTNFFEKYKLSEVFEPFHLRYLAFVSLSYKIPVAISGLHNLQTLIIHASFPCEFVHLPVEIWNLRQLRHLIVHNCHLPKQEGELYALENLQTLTKAVDFICSEEKLRMILNLKKLGILVRKHREDYQLHNLVHLQKLEILTIETDSSITRWHMVSLAFPPTLRKLSLSGVGLPWEDMEIVGSLPNLQVLKLRNHGCSGRTWATKEGGFSQLKFLLLDRTDLEFWITQSSHFPKLECLVLHHCGRLRKIPSEMGEILTLKSIEVDDLNRSLLDSAKQMQAQAHVQVQVHAVEKRMTIVARLMVLRSLALDSISMCSIM